MGSLAPTTQGQKVWPALRPFMLISLVTLHTTLGVGGVTCTPIPQLEATQPGSDKTRFRSAAYQLWARPHTFCSLRKGELGVTRDTVFKPLGISH